jgi:hypothetical protein
MRLALAGKHRMNETQLAHRLASQVYSTGSSYLADPPEPAVPQALDGDLFLHWRKYDLPGHKSYWGLACNYVLTREREIAAS